MARTGFCVSKKGNAAINWCPDTFSITNLEETNLVHPLSEALTSARFSPNGAFGVLGMFNGMVYLFERSSTPKLSSIKLDLVEIHSVDVSNQGTMIIAGKDVVVVCSKPKFNHTIIDPITTQNASAAAISADGSFIAYGDGSLLTIRKFDPQTFTLGAAIKQSYAHEVDGTINCLRFSQGGPLLMRRPCGFDVIRIDNTLWSTQRIETEAKIRHRMLQGDEGEQLMVPNTDKATTDMVVSPDGKSVAFWGQFSMFFWILGGNVASVDNPTGQWRCVAADFDAQSNLHPFFS